MEAVVLVCISHNYYLYTQYMCKPIMQILMSVQGVLMAAIKCALTPLGHTSAHASTARTNSPIMEKHAMVQCTFVF